MLVLLLILARSLALCLPYAILPSSLTRSLAPLRSRPFAHTCSCAFVRLRPNTGELTSLSSFHRSLFVQTHYAKILSAQRLHRHLGRHRPDPGKPAVEGSLAPSPSLTLLRLGPSRLRQVDEWACVVTVRSYARGRMDECECPHLERGMSLRRRRGPLTIPSERSLGSGQNLSFWRELSLAQFDHSRPIPPITRRSFFDRSGFY